jgi:hypothetical protein
VFDVFIDMAARLDGGWFTPTGRPPASVLLFVRRARDAPAIVPIHATHARVRAGRARPPVGSQPGRRAGDMQSHLGRGSSHTEKLELQRTMNHSSGNRSEH